MNTPLARSLVAEAIGTFALVFAGCGAVMVDAGTHQLGHVGVAISFGLVIMFGIYAVGHISGAHFNPAVTFAFALTRHFPWPRALAYWSAQVVGAVVAATLLRASLGDIAHVGATLPSQFASQCPTTATAESSTSPGSWAPSLTASPGVAPGDPGATPLSTLPYAGMCTFLLQSSLVPV